MCSVRAGIVGRLEDMGTNMLGLAFLSRDTRTASSIAQLLRSLEPSVWLARARQGHGKGTAGVRPGVQALADLAAQGRFGGGQAGLRRRQPIGRVGNAVMMARGECPTRWLGLSLGIGRCAFGFSSTNTLAVLLRVSIAGIHVERNRVAYLGKITGLWLVRLWQSRMPWAVLGNPVLGQR